MTNCAHCGEVLRECPCLSVEGGSERCFSCGQIGNLPGAGKTRPVPHGPYECRDVLTMRLASVERETVATIVWWLRAVLEDDENHIVDAIERGEWKK
mgnify:CR=1 FL=1